ncbi:MULTISPECIES: YiiD C-terminal domain-containing protein [unclassified Marinobacterium]|uniref:YiiD C-terminal domain-containing protein n=1 Tax=unclassified Marinobacterium TaxID=2644139 RepID=UPI001568A165|nr:putative thioesterase [Marinobacterium sp. xm-g-48]NRP28351.1 putative thioesterase [Marinobacterium sp. xm-d-420]NRP37228.1 putative thioesterase [Marinobacterium sp. xm-d-579]NRP38178.1 putative thioesterase [Marinobacterium sp. xm-a-121]NRP53099.1 putative thioesterase [Marinobacterium sp. xm-v-242]NRP57550.1 putative thioesterase [Marinobacterium sp. xm-d-510]NRP59629.1 putative thioesterase [Marinobacterium sp. xm-d-564]NRP78272.1 putative thioesterase [Marinobacterium sp. xm-m-383]
MSDQAFLSWLHQAIPLTAAMQIDEIDYTGNQLQLSAPLEPNLNDKGTGFAGSIASIATLSGWCLLTLWLRERGIDADVMIAKSEQRYLAPVTDRLKAVATLPDDAVVEQFWQRFQEKQRARLPISVAVGNEQTVFELQGDYAAIQR